MPKSRNLPILTKLVSTPWGFLGLAANEHGLLHVILPRKDEKSVRRELRAVSGDPSKTKAAPASTARIQKVLDLAERQLLEYLSGKRRTFTVPLATPPGATAFTRAVWRACAEIPHGETRPYNWIAQRIGRPRASRAVGAALGANPLPLVVPCHRVIRGDGSLGGFGGGLPLKKRLLAHERRP